MTMTRTASDYSTVTVASQQLAVMRGSYQYELTSSVDAWYKVGPNGSVTASAADGSHYLAAGKTVEVAKRGSDDTVAIVRVGAIDGVCTLSLVEPGGL